MVLATTPRLEPVPPAVVEGLGDRGQRFVDECWTTYGGWTPPSLTLLREAGLLIDQLETVRGDKRERTAQRLLLQVLHALDFQDASESPAAAPAPVSKWAGVV